MTDRLKEFIESQHISIRAFEQKIGASNGLIRKAIANNTDIQSKWVAAVVDNYPQLNPFWLLSGKGEMLYEQTNQNADVFTSQQRTIENLSDTINRQSKIIETLTNKS